MKNSLWSIGVKSNEDDNGQPVVEVVAKEVKPTFLNKLKGAIDFNTDDKSVKKGIALKPTLHAPSNKVADTTKAAVLLSTEKLKDATSSTEKKATPSKGSGIRASTKSGSSRPSVYEESLEMLTCSLLIYTFSDLREIARDNDSKKSSLSEDQLVTPISMEKILKVIKTHRSELEKKADSDHGELKSRLNALKDLQKQQKVSPSNTVGRMLRGSWKSAPAALTHFHDETSMCYGIAVNHVRRRITVVFRGSVTFEDFITDAKKSHTKVKNTVAALRKVHHSQTPQSIRVHSGFFHYMFMRDEANMVRFDHIMMEVKSLLKQYPGYNIYATGHSLGGALATLFGFYAAQDDHIVKEIGKSGGQIEPVVVVSVASPRVGDNDFRAAFQTLESMGRLQHLRMSNKEDMVTLLPFVSLRDSSLRASLLHASPIDANVNLYKHCGIHLKLNTSNPSGESNDVDSKRKELFSVTYNKKKDDLERGYPEELKQSAVNAKSVLGSILSTASAMTAEFKKLTQVHGCDEYEARLVLCKTFLSNMTLDQLYQNESLVGKGVQQRSSS